MKSREAIGLAIITVAAAVCAAILSFGSGISQPSTAQILMNEKNTQSAVELVGEGKAVLIDVRTDDEWNAGHALGAIHFELAKLQSGELPPIPKDAAIYVYCRTGIRAGQAKTILEQNGYTNVTNLGGLANWQAIGGAVEK